MEPVQVLSIATWQRLRVHACARWLQALCSRGGMAAQNSSSSKSVPNSTSSCRPAREWVGGMHGERSTHLIFPYDIGEPARRARTSSRDSGTPTAPLSSWALEVVRPAWLPMSLTQSWTMETASSFTPYLHSEDTSECGQAVIANLNAGNAVCMWRHLARLAHLMSMHHLALMEHCVNFVAALRHRAGLRCLVKRSAVLDATPDEHNSDVPSNTII